MKTDISATHRPQPVTITLFYWRGTDVNEVAYPYSFANVLRAWRDKGVKDKNGYETRVVIT